MQKYNKNIERDMQTVYNHLNEKEKRLYAAVEAKKLGHGGTKYICQVLGCDKKTILRGIEELNTPESIEEQRIRKEGGGRKRTIKTIKNIDSVFLLVLKDYTAGDPMNENVYWTNLTQKEISEKMKEKGICISVTVVKQLLKKHGYVKRKQQKKKTMKHCPDRNQQFEIISELKGDYLNSDNPVISVDTKKKEYIGNFYREGTLYAREQVEVFDHDFNSFAEGIVIPHGIYDLKKNTGFVTIGTSHDTAEFACDSLFSWWKMQGNKDYPTATSILILCDGGGSNSCRHYTFKEELQNLSNKIGLKLRVAHYPPYCSKYNPIEHRMFPHVSRACKGVVFRSIELVKSLIDKTKTSKGLKVISQIVKKIYEVGKKVSIGFKENMKIVFENRLPKWNYTVIPHT